MVRKEGTPEKKECTVRHFILKIYVYIYINLKIKKKKKGQKKKKDADKFVSAYTKSESGCYSPCLTFRKGNYSPYTTAKASLKLL